MSTATAAMDPVLTAPTRSRTEREPTPPTARRGAAPWQDLAVRAHDDVLRVVRAADARRDHRRAAVDGGAGIPEVRARVLLHRRLGSGEAQLRRARTDLRHARHLGDRAADRRAGELRHRVVPDRDVSGRAQAPARAPRSSCWRRSRRSSTACGGCSSSRRCSATTSSRCSPRLSAISGYWGRCSRARPTASACCRPGFILSIMVIPFIASVMRDVFEIVPPVLKESAYGIGATTWEVVWNVVLPYTKVGVIGGIMLGLGRALGETMAVTFVIGNAYRISAFAVRARQLDRLGARQRVQRGGGAGAPRVADRARPRAVPAHRSSCSPARDMLLAQLAEGGGQEDMNACPLPQAVCSSTGSTW